jgi:hypothetical protein
MSKVENVSSGEPGRAAQLLSGPRGREVCARVALQQSQDLDLPHDGYQTATLLGHLDQVDTAAIAALRDPLDLMAALSRSVDSAMYWQEPHEENQLLDDPLIVTALEPVARALAAAPAAHWWWSPVDLEQQAISRWLDRGQAKRPELVGVRERLERWRSDTIAEEERAAKERPAAFDANYSGSWWSTPVLADITTTSRRIGGLPAAQLELVEDSMGWTSARVAAVRIRPEAKIYEISDPADWVELVERHPLDVDRSRRHDWWRATGGTGPWQIPDWLAVSRDHDGVHLSVIAYLAGAGRALPTRHGQTVLAGFDPDLTYWLTDNPIETSQPNTWKALDDEGRRRWVPGVAR